jgi:hypothetical protein
MKAYKQPEEMDDAGQEQLNGFTDAELRAELARRETIKHETVFGLIISDRVRGGARIVTVRGRRVNLRAIQSANRIRKGGAR